MEFLTTEQCRRWATDRGWTSAPPRIADFEASEWTAVRFTIPGDASRRVALARILWRCLPDASTRLLWITGWSVWPSGEHVPLYAALRQAFGDSRALVDAPGHAIAPTEDDAGLSILVLTVLFLWDVWALSSGSALYLSDDEFGVFLARDEGVAISVEEKLGTFMGQRGGR